MLALVREVSPQLAQCELTHLERAAIDAQGTTVAVLGTPLTAVYPRANGDLQRWLARDQLVVSQVPMLRYGRQDMHRSQ